MPNNMQVWVFVIVFAFSGISWVVRKLQEQAAIKAANDREARRREEILRTGRDPATEGGGASEGSLDDAQARLRELAQRRQAQLRELRKREQAGGGEAPAVRPTAPKPAQGQPTGPVTAELWPGGPVVVVRPAPQPPAQAAKRPSTPSTPSGQQRPPEKWSAPAGGSEAAKAEREQTAKRAARAAANKRAEQVQRAAEKQEAQETAIAKAQAARVAKSVAAGERRASLAAATLERSGDVWTPPRTADGWRQAFIASEVFGPPVSARQDHLSGRGG